MRKKTISYLLIMIGAAALLCGLFLAVREIQEEHSIHKKTDEALDILTEILPERSRGLVYAEDDEEEMGCIEINGLNFVGYVQIGDVYAFAVQNEYGSEYAPRMKEGKIRSGTGVIITDILNTELIPTGTPVIFTDVSGTEYTFYVDYIGDGDEILKNAQLIIVSEGMTSTVQIGCIAG